ncbi:MAG TPA: hypothetical protein VFQ31_00965 [Methyloceanibacter sp.]|nr:hypothetical protein [Methyloceanibacter sp.]
MVDGLMRGFLIAGLLLLVAAAANAAPEAAGALNTEAFVAACVADPVVTDEPGFAEGGKATPKSYCECIAGKFALQKLTQSDVDMMTKMHKDEITDEDAASYATLEELMATNENIEDDCKESLGMPSADDDEEGLPANEEDIPQDE